MSKITEETAQRLIKEMEANTSAAQKLADSMTSVGESITDLVVMIDSMFDEDIPPDPDDPLLSEDFFDAG